VVCFFISLLRFNATTMYQALTFYHSITRWLVLGCLLYAIVRACRGYRSKLPFTKADNAIRHWTATVSHLQLIIGTLLYSQSPMISYFWKNSGTAFETVFFALIHGMLMLAAIALITVGSALAKRKQTAPEKFKTMLVWFSIALFIIVIAVPWPFSPLATRPYFR
jgi:hypothetical protein